MTIPLDEQHRIFDAHIRDVALDLSVLADEVREALRQGLSHPVVDLARRRLSENHPVYGDSMFHAGGEAVDQNQDEELADWLAYGIADKRRRERMAPGV
jgi:hypothetical protein